MKLTVYEAEVLDKSLNVLAAVKELANANSPHNTAIRISTEGAQQSGSCSISARALAILIEAGRAALEAKKEVAG